MLLSFFLTKTEFFFCKFRVLSSLPYFFSLFSIKVEKILLCFKLFTFRVQMEPKVVEINSWELDAKDAEQAELRNILLGMNAREEERIIEQCREGLESKKATPIQVVMRILGFVASWNYGTRTFPLLDAYYEELSSTFPLPSLVVHLQDHGTKVDGNLALWVEHFELLTELKSSEVSSGKKKISNTTLAFFGAFIGLTFFVVYRMFR